MAGAGAGEAAAKSGAMRCDLVVGAGSDGSVTLTGLATSGVTASGQYTLVISKAGDKNDGMEQSGNFTVAAGGASTLSTVTLAGEPGATYQATLTVSSKAGTHTCRRDSARSTLSPGSRLGGPSSEPKPNEGQERPSLRAAGPLRPAVLLGWAPILGSPPTWGLVRPKRNWVLT